MARYDSDARITFSGNVELARQYVGEARKYLGALDDTHRTQSASRHVTNTAGIRFTVENIAGQRRVNIWAPAGGAEEGPGFIKGYLMSQRTLASPQGFSTSPYVLLEPAMTAGVKWKSYFCLPDENHPAAAYPYEPKTLNKILIAMNTAALNTSLGFDASIPSYWTNAKQDLFLQFWAPISNTNQADSGTIIHNAKTVFEIEADHPDAPTSFVQIAACGAKRTARGLTVVVASYTAASYYGPCYLKIHAFDLAPTAEERARLAEFSTLVDNANSYAAEFAREGEVRELHSIALSKNPNQVWFNLSVNGSCSEVRGIVTENPEGVDTLREYVIDISDLNAVSHTIEREWAPVVGDWQDLYAGHIGDCPVYGEALLADPGSQYRFRTYVPNPNATSALDAYIRTANIWLAGAGESWPLECVSNIGAGCAAQANTFGNNTIVANTAVIFTG